MPVQVSVTVTVLVTVRVHGSKELVRHDELLEESRMLKVGSALKTELVRVSDEPMLSEDEGMIELVETGINV